MNNINKILKDHYNAEEEDNRLKKDLSHQVEFITTINYINKYLQLGDKIIEIGAGTGAYSLYFADQGFDVTAIELLDSNIDMFKSKIKENMKISAEQGNALDLSKYEDETFDITLVLGPLYHLFTEEEQKQAINEAIRVTKNNGIIYIAFISHDAVMINYGFLKGNIKDAINKSISKKYRLINKPDEIFYLFDLGDFKKLMTNFDLEQLHYVAAEGLSNHLRDYVNEFDEETYKHWINNHLLTCEKESLIGYSDHILYIGRKIF